MRPHTLDTWPHELTKWVAINTIAVINIIIILVAVQLLPSSAAGQPEKVLKSMTNFCQYKPTFQPPPTNLWKCQIKAHTECMQAGRQSPSSSCVSIWCRPAVQQDHLRIYCNDYYYYYYLSIGRKVVSLAIWAWVCVAWVSCGTDIGNSNEIKWHFT